MRILIRNESGQSKWVNTCEGFLTWEGDSFTSDEKVTVIKIEGGPKYMPLTVEHKHELARLLYKFSSCENLTEYEAVSAEYTKYRKPLDPKEIDQYFVELNRQRATKGLRSIAMYTNDCWKKCCIIRDIASETFDQFILLTEKDTVNIVSNKVEIVACDDTPPDESEELPPEE